MILPIQKKAQDIFFVYVACLNRWFAAGQPVNWTDSFMDDIERHAGIFPPEAWSFRHRIVTPASPGLSIIAVGDLFIPSLLWAGILKYLEASSLKLQQTKTMRSIDDPWES